MKVKNLLVIIISVITVAISNTLHAQALNKLTPGEKSRGYALIFNGKNLNGWHSYLKDQPGPAWKVENGVIALIPNGSGSGDLTTDKEYHNFDLKLEWKISQKGNSGIIFDVHESPQFKQTYLTGPEMQVLDNEEAEDNKKATHLAGSLYDIIAAPSKAAEHAGKWNKVRIKLNQGHLKFWLNGHNIVDTEMWDKHWKKLVNHSKFKSWKDFATYKKGHIALQNHGHKVWFRNLKIKDI